MNNSRGGSILNRSFLNASLDSNLSSMSLRPNISGSVGDKPSFSSLFTGPSSVNTSHKPNIEPFPSETLSVVDDNGGVYLQISNLDQWYDETNLRNYLMSQLKPITPILSLTIETPSIAKIKVPSVQVSRTKFFPFLFAPLTPSWITFSHPAVCEASRIALASEENGAQAHFRVLHEG